MRLGGYFRPADVNELEQITEKLDIYGLSCIPAPPDLENMSDEACVEFGEKARQLGIVIGEAGMWDNVMSANKDSQNHRIQRIRLMLKKADLMGCRSVVSCVGSKDSSDHQISYHPYNFTDECKAEFREVVLRILDGLNLKTARYIIEPWHNTFFYRPEVIAQFFESVNDDRFGLHLDQMNLVRHDCFYDTTSLIEETFSLLADRVVSVHLKDVACDHRHMFMKYDEVYIGDGVMDYPTYLTKLSGLEADMPCYCEHMKTEEQYALNFARLHHLAKKTGTNFISRQA